MIVSYRRAREEMNKDFIIDLAKVLIAASWADGQLTNEEINALKDLLFSLGEVSADDWTVLTMYMESPPSQAEQDELEQRLLDSIRTGGDKALAIGVLDRLVQSDGRLAPEEERLLDKLKGDIEATGTSPFGGIAHMLKSAITRRKAAVNDSCLRETESDDYVRNTLYYDLMRKLQATGMRIDLPDAQLRKLCLATGLLAHVAYVDSEFSPEERDAIRDILASDWNLTKSQAELLADLSRDRATRGLDYFRLSVGFFECTTEEERAQFLKTLFRVANAANKTDSSEIEEIRFLAQGLKLSHQDFIAAKLTIPREDRNGL